MEQTLDTRGMIWRRTPLLWVLFCAAGVTLNVAGASLASCIGLPLYLDSTGTILAAAIGGYLPGVVVGYLSNLVYAVSTPTWIFYSGVNVLIALLATYLTRRGYFRRFPHVLVTPVLFGILGGVLGSGIGMVLYQFDISGGVSGPLAVWFYETAGLPAAVAKLTAELILDIGDKFATVALAVLAMRLLPRALEQTLGVFPWRFGAPAASEQKNVVRCRTASLRTKILLLISAAILCVAVTVTTITSVLYRENVVSDYTDKAVGVTRLVASVLDPDKVDDFLAHGEAADGYSETERLLYQIRDSSPDIEYVYVYRILPDGCHVVFDLDTEEVAGGEPGEIVPFDESFAPYIPDLLAGHDIDPIITDDSFGWLLTVYEPVRTADGECVCYAAVDISMYKLQEVEMMFMGRVITLFSGFFILALTICLWFAEHKLIAPLNSIARVAGMFAYDSETRRKDSIEHIRALDIRTGDEIENLYQAIAKTTEDTMRYIADSQKKAKMIEKMQNGLILVLADLVESRDQNTGDHVRKTAAYAEVIMKEMRAEGIYADQLTDEFIEEVINAAPLHDVGKIHVPDAVLNKPGRLTEDEFAEMKDHTVSGSEIISHAIAIVPGSTYLKEAKNLAAFHHERWDGTGYPTGLAGEEIPLSARIMAVADVFDALVSTRSYKKGFPFEKAIRIIREGAGTHFDPNVAAAFLNAEEEVHRIANSFGEGE